MSTIKDSSTNEILAHYVSDNLRLDIVLNTLEKLKSNVNLKLHSEAILHSDQGVHYTSPKFQKQVQRIRFKTIYVKERQFLGQCSTRIILWAF